MENDFNNLIVEQLGEIKDDIRELRREVQELKEVKAYNKGKSSILTIVGSGLFSLLMTVVAVLTRKFYGG